MFSKKSMWVQHSFVRLDLSAVPRIDTATILLSALL